MRLPPTTDCEDLRVEALRAIWVELAAYVRRRLRPYEQHLLEDFMNEAAADFTAVWRQKGPMSVEQAIAVLKQAARGDIINHRHKENRPNTRPYSVDDEVLINHADPDSGNDVLAALGRIDHERLIEQLPQLLTERERQVIVAVDVDGLPAGRAAALLGITVDGLRRRRNAGLDRLRRHLTAAHSLSSTRVNRAHTTTREVPS
ncbi:RNA polymerase sigma factor [Actinophytocola xanthii]|uniref:RNA polymerase sigma-70 region 4 domain-containing protein n=1 Tax=Actinophytocola xanthii TaxID=1912961 RepID=A0A1Q8BR51_9PSEU|nr:sigma-70 family RNA polymerase sigma factor [Actinophytocola xanthii]OLF04574.1 hypothetical protein BU204_37645 [Actinophytocola xanthii]